jgi:hypothetical protein
MFPGVALLLHSEAFWHRGRFDAMVWVGKSSVTRGRESLADRVGAGTDHLAIVKCKVLFGKTNTRPSPHGFCNDVIQQNLVGGDLQTM